MVRVKICGITNLEDAEAAAEAGADALGFVFAESPRKVSTETAASIITRLPPFIETVAVFAKQDTDEILRIIKTTGASLAQVHGEIPDVSVLLSELGGRRIIRALRIRSVDDIEAAIDDCPECAAFLLDAHVEGMMGGTGQTFDWSLAVRASVLGRPIILAGGLTCENVEEAVHTARPYAVDVSSGVEKSPGKKDRNKTREFIKNAKKHT